MENELELYKEWISILGELNREIKKIEEILKPVEEYENFDPHFSTTKVFKMNPSERLILEIKLEDLRDDMSNIIIGLQPYNQPYNQEDFNTLMNGLYEEGIIKTATVIEYDLPVEYDPAVGIQVTPYKR